MSLYGSSGSRGREHRCSCSRREGLDPAAFNTLTEAGEDKDDRRSRSPSERAERERAKQKQTVAERSAKAEADTFVNTTGHRRKDVQQSAEVRGDILVL